MATNREQNDLGFGSVVAASRVRLMNRDGSFNVERDTRLRTLLLSPYQELLQMGWTSFLATLVLAYLATNIAFALLFLLSGPNAIGVASGRPVSNTFLEAFFLSVQTFGTIGFGELYPGNAASNWVVSFESLVSLLAVALATGLMFARFSRPALRLRFSRFAVVAPYRGISAFMFRIVNTRHSEVVGIEATVMYTRFEMIDGTRTRKFDELALERKRVTFFSLGWTIVHPIDESSPLYGRTAEDLRAAEAEFLILLQGTDEVFSQTVHTRSSYTATEIHWGAKFANIFLPIESDGILRIDLRLFDKVEPAALPLAAAGPAVPPNAQAAAPVA